MPDYRKLYDGDFLGAWDLKTDDGRAQTFVLTIEHVDAGELQAPGKNVKRHAPVIRFKGAKKRLVLNKTNGATIAALYGTDTRAWVGKRIAIYPTTTKFGRKTVDCIRVRPEEPPANARSTAAPAAVPVTVHAELSRDPERDEGPPPAAPPPVYVDDDSFDPETDRVVSR